MFNLVLIIYRSQLYTSVCIIDFQAVLLTVINLLRATNYFI